MPGTNGLVRHKIDADTHHGMAEAGFLRAGDRVELIDGEIVDGRQLAKTTKLSFVVLPALW